MCRRAERARSDAGYNAPVESAELDEEALFRALQGSGARWLLIGRRALVALGIPVLTADYDLWIDGDDAAKLNDAVRDCGLAPNRAPAEARKVGRYVLEGDEHVDVLVAKQASTKDGVPLRFDDAWARRRAVPFGDDLVVWVPSLPDLILTKKWSMRRKDVDDIDALEALLRSEEQKP